MPGNIELSGLEISLVNIMSRELVLEIQNAVLKSENQELKAQVAKLKKALSNLM